MTVDKTRILDGDRQQFLALLRPFFTAGDIDIADDISSESRLDIASALWTERSLTPEWSANGGRILLKDIERSFGSQSSAFQAEMQFHFKVIEGCVRFSHLDKQLTVALSELRLALLAHAVADDRFWFSSHPLRKLIDLLYISCVGWQESLGKNGEPVAELFLSTVAEISEGSLQDFLYYQQLFDKVDAELTRLTGRFEKLEKRLKDSETGVLKAGIANYSAISFINKICKGRKLPAGVASALQQQFTSEMKLLIIQQGLDCPFWLRGKKLMEQLVKRYQAPPASDAERKILLQLPGELEQFVQEAFPDPSQLENFINIVSFDFTQIAGGRMLDVLEDVTPLEMPGSLEGVEKKVSSSLVAKARKYTEGQWFLYKDGDDLKRCHLLLAMPDYDQLLFSNYVGQKVLATTYENFAYLLSSRLMQPLFQGQLTDRSVQLNLDKLLEEYEAKEEARRDAERQQALREQQVREEQERKEAAEKARIEAERLAQERADQQVQETLAQIADDMKRQVKLALDSLSLGSWVDWLNPETEQFKRIKLAVKFNATKRFVFVDEDGVTVLESHKDDLVDLVLLKKMKLLESDQKFAERLAKVVNNIRTGEV